MSLAGVVTTGAIVAWPFLFPMVEAAGDPSDFRLARIFYTSISVVAGLTIVSAWITHNIMRFTGSSR